MTDDVENPFSIRKTMDNTRRLNDLVLNPPDINQAVSSLKMGQQIIEDQGEKKKNKIKFCNVTEFTKIYVKYE